ncbi:hypothetical protein BZG35_08210 [Brevundimonas sp. LM2]|nr:hypothetical protein BZG35_08210 [Brevundimonas sp. LM2]
MEQEAQALRAWAEARQLFHAIGGSSGRLTPAGRGGGAEMFSAAAAEALTRKPITAVGFNPNRGDKGTVIVYTARPLNAGERSELIESYDRQAEIEFKTARPLVVDPGAASLAAPINLARQWSRYTCGSSVSLGNVRDAGTLGCLVRDREGAIYGLSANHVTGGCSNARQGHPIVAPGIKDVGAGQPDPRTIGYHDRAGPFVAGDPATVPPHLNTDAAIFKLIKPDEISSWQGDFYDTPAEVGDPIEDAEIEKVGRSTRRTKGVIESELAGSHPVSYKTTVWISAEEPIEFRATVYFKPVFVLRGVRRAFAAPGDSGALVTQLGEGNRRTAVGILFAGRESDVSYMLPLRPLLDHLELTLVSGHIPPAGA